MTVSLVARRHGVAPKQLWWLTADGSGEEVVPASDYRALQSQVRELQRLLDGCEAAKKEKRSRTVRSRRPKKKSSRAIVPSSSAWMAPRAPVSHRWSRPNIRSWRRGGRSKKNELTIARSRPLNKRSCREIVRNSLSAAWKNRQGIGRYGYEATREAAMAAFAKSWLRHK